MTKRQMIFNRAINPDTFVFFFWMNDQSWSIRDYSSPVLATTRYARDYPEQSPQTILAEAEHAFPVKAHPTEDTEYWFEVTRRLNDQYLHRFEAENAPLATGSNAGIGAPALRQSAPPPVPYRSTSAILAHIYVSTSAVEDWRRLLTDPERQWRDGYSAKLTAEQWQAAKGFPAEVSAALVRSGPFKGIEFLCGFPEHKVPLPGGGHPSQSDIFVLARTSDSLAAIMVEAKVDESFGPLLAEWSVSASIGKIIRLRFLRDILGLPRNMPEDIRYQLLHGLARR